MMDPILDGRYLRENTLMNSTVQDYVGLRIKMVCDQLEQRGIADSRVLAAMECVPREEFVPAEYRKHAYADRALPLACGQTISQPFTVAFMCEAAEILPTDRVLEIGTGSGYGAAVLSLLADRVDTVESLPELAESAAERLRRLGYTKAHVHLGDGTLGWPDEAPFDVIVVTAGAVALPPPYAAQLTDAGRIIIPEGLERHHQTMTRYVKQEEHLERKNLGSFAFVPLIGKHGWQR